MEAAFAGFARRLFSFAEEFWRDGALMGTKAEEAFFVT